MSKTIAKGQLRTTAALAAASTLGKTGEAEKATNQASAQYYTARELLKYLTEEEKQNLEHEVLTAINNELVHQEDLEVAVPRLLRSCYSEARELRRSINSISSSQIVETQRALQIVKESHKRIRDLRALFLQQGEIITGLGLASQSYAQLRQLHFLRRNVLSVIRWSLALKEVRFENLFAIIQEQQFADMYDRICKLQEIRRTVITQAGARYNVYRSIFDPYFSKLDAVIGAFATELLAVLEQDAMDVAIHKALEDPPADGQQQEPIPEFIALKECVEVCGKEVEEPILNFDSEGNETEPFISQEKIRDAVTKNVGKLWEEHIMIDVVDPIEQISVYLEQMRKVEPLVEALEITLIPLSTTFAFFGMVVSAIHGEVMRVMEGYVNPDIDVDANGLMMASEYVQWYKEMLTTCNYAQYVDLSTIDTLSASFVTAAVGGLSAHLTRLCRACAITVCNDRKGPTILPSGFPITTGPMDMFTILQQSLGSLSTSIELPVMRQVGRAAADAIMAFLEECKQRSDYDFWEEENESSEQPMSEQEWSQRRMMFLYAFCNDCSTIENNLETIELKFASCWELDVGEDVAPDSPFDRVHDALPDNAFYYLDEIVEQVSRIVGSQWQLAFRPGEWYDDDSNPIRLIINTEEEYIDEEFAVMLQEQRLRKITSQMLMRFIEKYISTLVEFTADVIRNPKKNTVPDWNVFIDCVARDRVLIMAMWHDRIAELGGGQQMLDICDTALEALAKLLAVKKPVDFTFFLQSIFLDNFGDCPTFVIRFIFDARSSEVDRESRDRMMAIWAEQVAYQQRKNDIPTTGWVQPPSLFGSIDRSIESLEKAGGFFSKSGRQKREEAKARQVQEAKEAKRTARKARRAADASSRLRGPKLPGHLGGGGGTDKVEVASLADILRGS